MSFSKSKFVKAVNLQHRFQPLSLYENLDPVIKRARAIADLIEVAVSYYDYDPFEPDTLRFAAMAIRMELADAKAMLEAHQNHPVGFFDDQYQAESSGQNNHGDVDTAVGGDL